ncbi:MAG TPA: hypothetical protein VL426_07030 [Candidatus Binatia bacterium]|jgi:hypothetical protein|nr:hypothetical protein [Candidatus Binatia bacterium]
MADAPGTPPTPWLDLLDEDIPVVDKSGKKLLVKGLDFVDSGAKKEAAPPPNLPTGPAAAVEGSAPSVRPPALTLVEKAEPVAASQPEVSLAKVTKDDYVQDAGKDAADLKKIEAIIAKKDVQPEKKSEVTHLDAIVDEAVAASGVPMPDEDVKRRFRMLVSLFFRDLRDGLETKSKFTMPVQSGGMGMSDADADRVMDELQRKNRDFHSGLAGEKAGEKAKYVAEQTEKVLTGQDTADKKDQANREQTFSDLLQRSGVAASGVAAAPPREPVHAAPSEPKVVPVVGLDSSGKPTPTTVVVEPPPASPSGPAPAQPAQPAVRPAPQPSAQQPAQASPQAQPVMSDVKFSPKLTGPVEELRSMTIKDFRRLSKDPREATLKLKDKIDLLEEQSFDVKTQGIRAWQDSEVNKLYLDILRKSLEGKPVTEVIAELESKAAPYLSKAEFDSVMELNRKLRFG